SVRRQGSQSLSQVNDERVVATLDSLLTSGTDSDLQESALSAIARHASPESRAALHRVAENTTIPIELRTRAVSYIGSRRDNVDDTAYLQSLFGKTSSIDLRDVIMRSVA